MSGVVDSKGTLAIIWAISDEIPSITWNLLGEVDAWNKLLPKQRRGNFKMPCEID